MTRYTQGWLLILVMVGIAGLLLSGCTRPDHSPLAAYGFDPKSLNIPVMTLFSVGF